MSLWGKILGIGGAIGAGIAAPFTGGATATLIPSLIGAGGAAASAIGSSMAKNRGEEFGGQLDLESVMLARERQLQQQQIAREQEGRAGASDAWRKLLSAQRTLSPKPRSVMTPYAMPERRATATELEGADLLTQEVMGRLRGGNPIPEVTQHELQVDPKLLKGSAWENILGGLGAAGTAYGTLATQQDEDPPIMTARNQDILKRQMAALPLSSMRWSYGA